MATKPVNQHRYAGIAVYVDDRQTEAVYSEAFLSIHPNAAEDALRAYQGRYGERAHLMPVYPAYGQWWSCANA